MKLRLLLISLVGFFILSCDKNNPEPKKDEIVYNDIIPDKEIHSVRFYTFQDHSICTANVPTPSDSSIKYDIDIDNDQVFDFRINVAHSKYTYSYCGHCDRFTYSISVEGLSANNLIAKSSGEYPILKIFNESDTLSNKNTWVSSGNILLQEGCSLPFNASFNNGFLGVRIKKSLGYIRVERLSNNGIRILEYGFNKTEDNAIKCGQTE